MNAHEPDDEQLRAMAERGFTGQGAVVFAVQRLGKQIDDVKASVERLAKPHWLLWLTFIVSVIAATASVIGYWPQIVAAVQAFRAVFGFAGTP